MKSKETNSTRFLRGLDASSYRAMAPDAQDKQRRYIHLLDGGISDNIGLRGTLDALISNAQVQAGDTVLVTAAASGIGTATIQLAKYYQAKTVFASTRDANKAAALKDLGADVVIDTSKPGFIDSVDKHTNGEGVDIIIDSVGGPMFADNLEMLAVKGRIVTVGRNAGEKGEIDLDVVANKRAQIIGTTFRSRSPQEAWRCFEVFVEDCMDGFSNGSLRPVLDRTFPFRSLHEAHDYMLQNGQVGKIVLARDSLSQESEY